MIRLFELGHTDRESVCEILKTIHFDSKKGQMRTSGFKSVSVDPASESWPLFPDFYESVFYDQTVKNAFRNAFVKCLRSGFNLEDIESALNGSRLTESKIKFFGYKTNTTWDYKIESGSLKHQE